MANFKINISRKLGEMLVSSSFITQDQLYEALEYQKKSGLKLGQILIEKGYITEKQLLEFLSKQFSIRFIEISKTELNPDIVALIPESMARRYNLIAVNKENNLLSVAMVDPLNIVVLDELKLMTGYNVEPVFALEDDINSAIDKYYGTKSSQEALDEILKKTQASESEGNLSVVENKEENKDDIISLEGKGEAAPIIKMVNIIISSAIKSHASDIHIEPSYRETKVRFRIDGVLHPQPSVPKKFHNAIISRLKIMANLDISERRIPQDGRIKIKISEKEIDLRLSVLPCVYGEKVVMRILDSSGLKLRLEDLGFEPENLAIFSKCIKAPHGINLITGPTGSGKSTTLYSALSTLNTPDVNISTIEDPVEYNLEGINQVSVNSDVGLTFASGLRSFLRQDPDIIMVGEIRDFETMSIAINAAMTGHLVFSTLHTNDAPGAITRIGMMGIEPFLTSSTLLMVVAQRLVRTVCKNCKEAYEVKPELIIGLGASKNLIEQNIKDGKLYLYKGKGCEKCSNTGYKGRVGIHEILEVTDPIRELIISKTDSTKIKEVAKKNGMITLRESALRKMMLGLTTVEEVIRVTGSDVD
ncbi:MAG TPA: type IV-A pilus assembly ATPase PilB [Elusimicrobiales bacterium]|mgnify:CR=1 FL=1|nr:type IV-A pilus assembly ATPase PilB [Elusimicrobiales bacterium]HPO95771.1 type IV-A pilus assembly ATPase PilB [Elusimicrobiales bacterium]